jgi:hypothetical protein
MYLEYSSFRIPEAKEGIGWKVAMEVLPLEYKD